LLYRLDALSFLALGIVCACGSSCASPTRAYILYQLEFQRTDLELEVPSALTEPVHAIFKCVLSNPLSVDTSWLRLRFHGTASIDSVETHDGKPVSWKPDGAGDGSRKWIEVDLGRSLKPGETFPLVIKYSARPFPDSFAYWWESGVYVQSPSDLAPRLDIMDRDFPCPRRILVRWKNDEAEKALLAGPGGVVEMQRQGGYLQGEIETGSGEVGHNSFLCLAYDTLVEAEGVQVYGLYSRDETRDYGLVARILAQSRELLEKEIGPLGRPVVGIETPHTDGSCLYPGVVLFPQAASVVREPFPGLRTKFISHELAHSYFGASLFVWGPGGQLLVEGVAEFLSCHVLEQLEGPEALRFHLEDYRNVSLDLVSSPPTLSMLPPGSQFTPLTYARGAYVFRMIEARIGRAPLLSALQEMWRTHRWKVFPFLDFYEYPPLRTAWERSPRPPEWPQFLAWWLETNELPSLSLAAGHVRFIRRGTYQTSVTLKNSGKVGVEVELEFLGDGEENARRKVFVGPNETATLEATLPWKPVSVEVDPDLWILEARFEELYLEFAKGPPALPRARDAYPSSVCRQRADDGVPESVTLIQERTAPASPASDAELVHSRP
jgi:hypothetical protein